LPANTTTLYHFGDDESKLGEYRDGPSPAYRHFGIGFRVVMR
jgi:hypothetical protein